MTDTTKLLPCLCGYSGRLDGTYNGWWHELKCPQCGAKVEAFTAEGMVAKWQEKNLVEDHILVSPELAETLQSPGLENAQFTGAPGQLTPTGRISNHQLERQRLPSAPKELPEPKVMPAVDFSSLELRVVHASADLAIHKVDAEPSTTPAYVSATKMAGPGMTSARYNELRKDLRLALTKSEVADGWYFDYGLLVHESWEGHERG